MKSKTGKQKLLDVLCFLLFSAIVLGGCVKKALPKKEAKRISKATFLNYCNNENIDPKSYSETKVVNHSSDYSWAFHYTNNTKLDETIYIIVFSNKTTKVLFFNGQ